MISSKPRSLTAALNMLRQKTGRHNALEELYVRAQRLVGFKQVLEACYPDICDEIEAKMISVVHGSHGW